MTTYISDLFGVSGRNLLQALMKGELITSRTLSTLAKGHLKKKIPLLVDALNGRVRQHHREMIRLSWEHLIYIESSIRQVEELIDQKLVPYDNNRALLQTIPSINQNAAAVLIAEMGTDMSIFPSHKHLASWAGVSLTTALYRSSTGLFEESDYSVLSEGPTFISYAAFTAHHSLTSLCWVRRPVLPLANFYCIYEKYGGRSNPAPHNCVDPTLGAWFILVVRWDSDGKPNENRRFCKINGKHAENY